MPRRRSKKHKQYSLEERRAAFARLTAAIARAAEESECEVKDDGRGTGEVRFSVQVDALTRHSRYFEATANPLHAWQVYAIARRDQRPIPEYVLAYFDACATRLLDKAALKAGSQANYAAEGIGLKKPGRTGRKNLFRDFHENASARDIALAAEVELTVADGTKRDFAYDDVARAHGLSRSTVRRAHRSHISQVQRAWTLMQPWGAAMQKLESDGERYRQELRKAVSKKSVTS